MSIYTGFAAIFCLAVAIPVGAVAGTLTTLHTFTGKKDGDFPSGPLIYANGSLFGTASGEYGYNNLGYGNVFRIKLKTGHFTIMHTFGDGNDGADPLGGVIYQGGLLYGTTEEGGGNGCSVSCGTIFSLSPNSDVETILYTAPQNTLWRFDQLTYLSGSLYGTTPYGGATSNGSVFSFNLSTNTFATLHSFNGDGDGFLPRDGLLYHNGLFYGVTEYGGEGSCYGGGCGTVFSLDPTTNTEMILHLFKSKKDGAFPTSNLIYHGGSFFGATAAGGNKACKYGCGVSFSIDAATGAEIILEINDSYADSPWGLTLQGGNAYETLPSAGTGAGELVERNLKSGQLTVLYTFGGKADGSQPVAPLLYHDGAFYGTTYQGGNGFGTVFKFVP